MAEHFEQTKNIDKARKFYKSAALMCPDESYKLQIYIAGQLNKLNFEKDTYSLI